MRRAGARSGSALDLLRAAMRARQPFPTPADAGAADRARAVAQISTAIAELACAGLLGASASWVLVSRHSVARLLGLRPRLETAPPTLLLASVFAAAAATLLLAHAIAPVASPSTPRRRRRRDAPKTHGGDLHIPPPSPPPRPQSRQRGPWLLLIVLNTATLLILLAGCSMAAMLRTHLPLDLVTVDTPVSSHRSHVPSLEGVGGAKHRDSWAKSRIQMRLRKGPYGDQLRAALEDSLQCCQSHWDLMQTKLECCGVDGPGDWRSHGTIPKSCCKGSGDCLSLRVDADRETSTSHVNTSIDGCLVPAALFMAEGTSLLIGLACVLGIFVTGSLALCGLLWAREVRRRHASETSVDGSPPRSSSRTSVADAFVASSSLVAASLDACFSSSSSSLASAAESARGGQRPASAYTLPSKSMAASSSSGLRPASARITRHVEHL